MRLNSGLEPNRERDVALCRSLLYQALALGFRPPAERTLQRLATESSAAALAEAAAVLDEERGTRLAARTRELAVPPAAGTVAELAEAYRNLFGHTARGPAPAYETEYGDDTLFQKPQEMADLAGFFRAFGLEPHPLRRERIDHVSGEIEFLAFLARKEAYALETGDVAMRAETRKATRLFLKDHPGRFVPSFAHRILRVDAKGFYGRLATLCLEYLRDECDRFEAPPGPPTLRLRIPIDDGAPIACGRAEGCAPGGCPPDPESAR